MDDKERRTLEARRIADETIVREILADMRNATVDDFVGLDVASMETGQFERAAMYAKAKLAVIDEFSATLVAFATTPQRKAKSIA